MTKDDLVTAVVKSCKGDDLSKRLVSDVIDATFESIGKSIKIVFPITVIRKDKFLLILGGNHPRRWAKKNDFLIRLLEHSLLETEKQERDEIPKQVKK